MKVLEIKDIVRKDVPIYYRRLFTGTAVLEVLDKALERRIEFTIETKPTGARETTVSMIDNLDYPLVPVIKELKDFISSLDRSGTLPC
jgi:hypothetical protein